MIRIKAELIEPERGERPAFFADRVSKAYADSATEEHKKGFGQYFTPVAVADYMASLVNQEGPVVNILDPGAGSGVLTCSLCESLIKKNKKIERIHSVNYEIDSKLLPYSELCLNYLKKSLEKEGFEFSFEVRTNDFILENAKRLYAGTGLFPDSEDAFFDVVISNPPYFKISKEDPRAKAARLLVHGQPNIYALFLGVSASLLKLNGELVFITPRSYAAGPYFRLFREKFFSMVKPEVLHLFRARNEAFDRDSILQENVILKARRLPPNEISSDSLVVISHSEGSKDLTSPKCLSLPLRKLVDMRSRHKVLFIPSSVEEERVIDHVNSWPGNLHKYGMEISTGPIVPFRSNSLIETGGLVPETHAPLLWMQNVRDKGIEWPLKGIKKQQYVKICRESMPLLIENKNYVLLRRFSAKEDKKRLFAVPYLSECIDSEWLGLENHINYIYRPEGELSKEEALGLSAVLGSEYLDTYFRTFNGNTQVSATEIRSIPLPPLESIRQIGAAILKHSPDKQLDELLISPY
jgi:adenine-specific DNA-methyltransferase